LKLSERLGALDARQLLGLGLALIAAGALVLMLPERSPDELSLFGRAIHTRAFAPTDAAGFALILSGWWVQRRATRRR